MLTSPCQGVPDILHLGALLETTILSSFNIVNPFFNANFAKVDLGLDIPGNMPQAIPMIKPAESKSAFIAITNNFYSKIPYKSHYY
jgi:hypothetical protein